MSAAARARRCSEHATITVLEKSGFISFANCGLPYYVSGKIKDEQRLYLTTPERVWNRFRIEARVHHEVLRIDRERKLVEGIDRTADRPFALPYDKLILAPGATPILPQLPGVGAPNVFVLRSIEDTQALTRALREREMRRAVVVGAGFIGLEMVEALTARGLKVAVVERGDHLLPAIDVEMSGWLEAELRRQAVSVHLDASISGFIVEQERVTAVHLSTGAVIETDLILLAMGVQPNTRLAVNAGLRLGLSGGIEVDKALRTEDPDIYAVGDAVQVTQGVTFYSARVPLAGAANRHGRIAGEHAVTGRAPEAAPVFGTAVVRVFGLDVAITGLSRAAARRAGYDAQSVIVHPNDHASYYPGAQPIHLQLVYDGTTGKVLGAQAIGAAGVDKRIDVVATLLRFQGTIDDLATLDLCYAPQFSSAKDPVHFAAFVAQNQRRGLCALVDELPMNATIVDVRAPEEAALGMLPRAINIPLDSLRTRLGELDPKQRVVLYCQSGMRAYFAARILLQQGFQDVANLKGGYLQAAVRTAGLRA